MIFTKRTRENLTIGLTVKLATAKEENPDRIPQIADDIQELKRILFEYFATSEYAELASEVQGILRDAIKNVDSKA